MRRRGDNRPCHDCGKHSRSAAFWPCCSPACFRAMTAKQEALARELVPPVRALAHGGGCECRLCVSSDLLSPLKDGVA